MYFYINIHSCGKEKTISEHLSFAVQKLTDYNEFRSQIRKIFDYAN